tara:strand:- start:1438 stop:3105 length:1668 start_codon:yes stop_codon:yes gene_type:complete
MFRERIQFLVALLLVVNGSLWSFQAAAVTLGEIELKSGLGEALRATIELVDDKNIDSNSFSAQLETGSGTRGQEVVDQLDLSSLSFQVVENEFGIRHLLIVSPAEVQQPELDFLVELQWPYNSVVIRVNLLFLAESGAAVAQIIATDTASPIYKVTRGDTLWSVANGFRLDNVTVWQAMDAMFIVNPAAFLNGDPSKIIIGSDISRPSYRQIANQSGFFVADQLGLDVYGETSNAAVIDDTATDLSLESLDIAYSNQEIPYFEVEDSIANVLGDSGRVNVGSDDNDLVINTDSSVISEVAMIVEEESTIDPNIEVIRLNDALLNAQNAAAEAQDETSDLRAIIISLNDEVNSLQEKLRSQQSKERMVVEQDSGDSKPGYLGSSLDGPQLMALVFVVLAGVGFLIFFAVRWSNRLEPVSKGDAEASFGSKLESTLLNPESGVLADEIFDGNDREPGDVFADTTSRDGAIEESLSRIGSGEFSDELDSENTVNLDYLDMTENIDPVDVKLDLAETYADLGDIAGAKEILEEIISESNKEGRRRATEVLERLDSNTSS